MLIDRQYRTNISRQELEDALNVMNPALDELFRQPWMTKSFFGRDKEILKELMEYAEQIRKSADLVLILAGRGAEADLAVRAALSAVPADEEAPEIQIVEPGLSPAYYSGLLDQIRGKNASLIVIDLPERGGAGAEEELAFRAAYHILKRAVISGADSAGSSLIVSAEAGKIYAICNGSSRDLLPDARDNDYPILYVGEEASPYLANAEAVLLPLAVRDPLGAAEYLKGFGDAVQSPDWDRDACVPAYEMLERAVRVDCWQQEYREMASWMAALLKRRVGQTDVAARSLPWELTALADERGQGGLYEILLASRDYETYLMTPLFDGCDPDGSLHGLMASTADHDFFASGEGLPGVKLVSPLPDAEAAGALMAFLQMTAWLAGHVQ